MYPPETNPKCPECGSDNLYKFVWVFWFVNLWTRHCYCNDCNIFLEEYYHPDDNESFITKHKVSDIDLDI